MKVRILSGNNAGAVVEMGQAEAQNAIDTGYAKPVDVEQAEPVVTEPAADLRRSASHEADSPEE